MYRKIKRKIKDGGLRRLGKECAFVWQYIVRYKGAVAFHLLMGVLGIAMSLAGTVASKYLIDAVIGRRDDLIVGAFAAMVGLRVGNILMRSFSSRIGAKLNIRIQNEIQSQVYDNILTADWQSLENYRSGDLLSRLGSDTNAVAGGVTGFIPSLISNAVQLLGAFLIIMHYDFVMAMLALVSVPPTVICSAFLTSKMRKFNGEMKEVYSDSVSFQQESFQNITVIKSFDAAEQFKTRMKRVQTRYKDKYLDYNRFSVRTSAAAGFLSLAAYFLCFGWGVYRLWSGGITYGDMTMFLQLTGRLGSSFSALLGLVPSAVSTATSAGRIMSVFGLPREKTRSEAGFENESEFTLRLDGVSFAYRGGGSVLENINIEAKPGELISVTGPSGEGKTTLLRILLGLVTPTEGRASLIGDSGKIYPLSAATRSVFGYVPQGNHIFTGTVEDNLRLTKPDATTEEIENALKTACADFVFEYSDGIKHNIGGRDKRLSEGQAQRIALARAVLKNAPILLLDEATSALDSDTERQLLKNLMSSGSVKTCIVVTHRPAAMQICDRNYHISDGRAAED